MHPRGAEPSHSAKRQRHDGGDGGDGGGFHERQWQQGYGGGVQGYGAVAQGYGGGQQGHGGGQQGYGGRQHGYLGPGSEAPPPHSVPYAGGGTNSVWSQQPSPHLSAPPPGVHQPYYPPQAASGVGTTGGGYPAGGAWNDRSHQPPPHHRYDHHRGGGDGQPALPYQPHHQQPSTHSYAARMAYGGGPSRGGYTRGYGHSNGRSDDVGQRLKSDVP
eukprot:SAG25_NODE_211_length_11820_cov_9.700793_4_plen_216_part_00